MKSFSYSKPLFALLAGACALLPVASQADLNYRVTVDTGSLMGSPGDSFSLDFQLNNGGGAFPNTVTLSNFSFGGGSAVLPGVGFGLASGSLGTTITLDADFSNAFNEFYQGFTPGSLLAFDVMLTTNINTPTPDAFSFAILDKDLLNIPTGGLGNSLLLINLSSNAPTPQTFSAEGVPAPTVAAVPEPVTSIFGFALLGLCGAVRRRRSC